MKVDLHSHSIFSDGKKTIEELVNFAKERNVDIFALTDHDTVLGDLEVDEYNKDKLTIIKGVELSCEYKGEIVHIVGLFKNNIVPEYMKELSIKLEDQRRDRAIKMLNGIKEKYNAKIDIDSFIRENRIVTRKNIFNHIEKNNKNFTHDEIKIMAGRKSLAYIPSFKFDVMEAINLLHNNNAISIFAHPCLIENKDVLAELLTFPFDGIEAKYANPANDYEYFKKVAEERGLLISAGSDYHGDKTHGKIGDVYLDGKEFEPIKRLLGL